MRALKSLVSLPVLCAVLIGYTLLVAGPLRPYEAAWHRYWARGFPEPVTWILQQVLDRITGQVICLPVLLVVAVVLARRLRTWRPIVVVAAAEAAFFGVVGLMKLVLERPAPAMRDARFFNGGLLEDGWHGISYPSGHTAEAILIYGAAAYLIMQYGRPSPTVRRRLVLGVGLIAVNSVVTAYLLGWHWATDLPAGLLAGGVLLHVVIWVDRNLGPRIVRERVASDGAGTAADAPPRPPRDAPRPAPPAVSPDGPVTPPDSAESLDPHSPAAPASPDPADSAGSTGPGSVGPGSVGPDSVGPDSVGPGSVGPDAGDPEHRQLRADPHPQ